MKLKQHLDIGNKVINDNIIKTFEVNKVAYLFGNVAPDLNCIYPAHRLKTTEERFYKRLKRVDKASTNLIKSFTLGVITHYICDYFCFAHNIESLGIPHREYESNLYKYYESHVSEMEYNYEKLLNYWLHFKQESMEKYIVDNSLNSEAHIEFIMNQLKNMNEIYISSNILSKKDNWTTKVEQMQKDIEYTTFMIEHLLGMVLEPFKCVVGEF